MNKWDQGLLLMDLRQETNFAANYRLQCGFWKWLLKRM
jgi:hypothetical protein